VTVRRELYETRMCDECRSVAEHLLDEYAHELAEKIREKRCCNECGPYWAGAADLIDPEVDK
jgi:hypothetical protein